MCINIKNDLAQKIQEDTVSNRDNKENEMRQCNYHYLNLAPSLKLRLLVLITMVVFNDLCTVIG